MFSCINIRSCRACHTFPKELLKHHSAFSRSCPGLRPFDTKQNKSPAQLQREIINWKLWGSKPSKTMPNCSKKRVKIWSYNVDRHQIGKIDKFESNRLNRVCKKAAKTKYKSFNDASSWWYLLKKVNHIQDRYGKSSSLEVFFIYIIYWYLLSLF